MDTDTEGQASYICDNSTLLAASIAESSRLIPLAAFSVPQSCPTDRVVDGYRISAGTDIVVDSHSLNMRAAHWGPNPTQYRPSHFMPADHNASRTTDMRYRFRRFGFGPRQCMGRYVADLMIRALLVELLLKWRLDFLDGEEEGDPADKWKRDPESWIDHPMLVLKCVGEDEWKA